MFKNNALKCCNSYPKNRTTTEYAAIFQNKRYNSTYKCSRTLSESQKILPILYLSQHPNEYQSDAFHDFTEKRMRRNTNKTLHKTLAATFVTNGSQLMTYSVYNQRKESEFPELVSKRSIVYRTACRLTLKQPVVQFWLFLMINRSWISMLRTINMAWMISSRRITAGYWACVSYRIPAEYGTKHKFNMAGKEWIWWWPTQKPHNASLATRCAWWLLLW